MQDDYDQIGKELIASLGEIPGYGPITWWNPHSDSPLDGATSDCGIIVQVVDHDGVHHRFKLQDAGIVHEYMQNMGLQQLLGILVTLNHRKDTADVYLKVMNVGESSFRKRSEHQILTNVPFHSHFKDPNHPWP